MAYIGDCMSLRLTKCKFIEKTFRLKEINLHSPLALTGINKRIADVKHFYLTLNTKNIT